MNREIVLVTAPSVENGQQRRTLHAHNQAKSTRKRPKLPTVCDKPMMVPRNSLYDTLENITMQKLDIEEGKQTRLESDRSNRKMKRVYHSHSCEHHRIVELVEERLDRINKHTECQTQNADHQVPSIGEKLSKRRRIQNYA